MDAKASRMARGIPVPGAVIGIALGFDVLSGVYVEFV